MCIACIKSASHLAKIQSLHAHLFPFIKGSACFEFLGTRYLACCNIQILQLHMLQLELRSYNCSLNLRFDFGYQFRETPAVHWEQQHHMCQSKSNQQAGHNGQEGLKALKLSSPTTRRLLRPSPLSVGCLAASLESTSLQKWQRKTSRWKVQIHQPNQKAFGVDPTAGRLLRHICCLKAYFKNKVMTDLHSHKHSYISTAHNYCHFATLHRSSEVATQKTMQVEMPRINETVSSTSRVLLSEIFRIAFHLCNYQK